MARMIQLKHGMLPAIPSIGLGVYETEGLSCKGTVLEALKVGYRLIDTAQFYRNEKWVGEAIRESGIPRSEIFVTTKVYRGFKPKQELSTNIQESLDELGLDYIDLFLMHSPLSGREKRVSTWKFLNEIMQEEGPHGRVRSVGVSNFGVEHLKHLESAGLAEPSVNQIELHPHLQQHPIVDYCVANGILIQAYCPLMRGAESKQSLGEGAAWRGVKGYGWDAPALKDAAAAHGKTIAQVLIKWSLQKGFSPQPKTTNASRLLENWSVWDFELSPAEMKAIDNMDLTKDPAFTGKRIALEWNPVDCP